MRKVEALHHNHPKPSGKRHQHKVFTLFCEHLAILSNSLICFKLIPVSHAGIKMAIAEMKIDHFLQVFMAFRFFVLLAVAGVAILK